MYDFDASKECNKNNLEDINFHENYKWKLLDVELRVGKRGRQTNTMPRHEHTNSKKKNKGNKEETENKIDVVNICI